MSLLCFSLRPCLFLVACLLALPMFVIFGLHGRRFGIVLPSETDVYLPIVLTLMLIGAA